MFRSKRNSLVKRLWKYRVQHEAQCTTESKDELELKSVAQSMLKRLKEQQLDVLIQAVESYGGERTECVLLPKGDLRLGRRTVEPHVLCCQLWRWPENLESYELKRLTCCATKDDPNNVCCNPYHWSRLLVPDSPPPPYETNSDRVKIPVGLSEPVESTETGGTQTELRQTYNTGDTCPGGAQHGNHWCHVAYWELRQRVGRLFTVFEKTVNVFQELPHGDGMCLGILQQGTSVSDSVKRTREKIGFGVTLSQEGNAVWLYNRSEFPVFVNSPTLDIPNSRTFSVHKILPGYSIKIFDYDMSYILEETRDPQYFDGPFDPNAIRVSFAKGWGTSYSRQCITSCPCWIEILLHNIKR